MSTISASQSKRERLQRISEAITNKNTDTIEAIAREVASFDEEWAEELFTIALAIDNGIEYTTAYGN